MRNDTHWSLGMWVQNDLPTAIDPGFPEDSPVKVVILTADGILLRGSIWFRLPLDLPLLHRNAKRLPVKRTPKRPLRESPRTLDRKAVNLIGGH
jgi:hypothetical protein